MTPDLFPRWLATALARTPDGPLPVEDHERWANALADAGPADPPARARIGDWLIERLLAGPLSSADRAAALVTALSFAAADLLTPEFTPACRGDDYFRGLATELGHAIEEEGGHPAGRVRLVWLLRACLRHRAGLEPHLSDTVAAKALAAVAALADGVTLPPADGHPLLVYLHTPPSAPRPSAPPTPTARERVREFVGGNRFEFTRAGVVRAAVLLALVAAAAVFAAVGVFAGNRLESFRTDNHLPDYERSLVPR